MYLANREAEFLETGGGEILRGPTPLAQPLNLPNLLHRRPILRAAWDLVLQAKRLTGCNCDAETPPFVVKVVKVVGQRCRESGTNGTMFFSKTRMQRPLLQL
jgi:hypothetical protein